MDMFIGYASFAITYLILLTVFLFLFVKTKMNSKIKAVLIAAMIWYSVAIYSAPGHFMGWPTPKVPTGNVMVLNYRVQEPDGFGGKGALYFWIIDRDFENSKILADPRNAFSIYIAGAPRSFMIEYNSETHKQLAEADKKRRKSRGSQLQMNMEGLTTFEIDKNPFKIIEPEELLQKIPGQEQQQQ